MFLTRTKKGHVSLWESKPTLTKDGFFFGGTLLSSESGNPGIYGSQAAVEMQRILEIPEGTCVDLGTGEIVERCCTPAAEMEPGMYRVTDPDQHSDLEYVLLNDDGEQSRIIFADGFTMLLRYADKYLENLNSSNMEKI